jgi:KUP system potassium uptake protein
VKIEGRAYVPLEKRLEVHDYGEGFYRVVLRYGFMDEINVFVGTRPLEGCGRRVR